MSKGDDQRPSQVSGDQVSENWKNTFGSTDPRRPTNDLGSQLIRGIHAASAEQKARRIGQIEMLPVCHCGGGYSCPVCRPAKRAAK